MDQNQIDALGAHIAATARPMRDTAQAGVDPRFAAAHYQDGRDLTVGQREGDGMVAASGEPSIPGMQVTMLEPESAKQLGAWLESNRDPAMDALFLRSAGNQLVDACHGASAKAGWWRNDGTDLRDLCRKGGSLLGKALVAQKLCLIHSEVSEAMEGHRKGLMDDKLPHRQMCEVELADAVIRICDLAGALGYDLGGAIAEKLAFNAVRPDHKLEARGAAGGKAY